MATQTLEFRCTTGLTITYKLFALEGDTVIASVVATEKTNDKGSYVAVFTDVPAGAYRGNGFVGSVGGFVNEIYDILLATDTYLPRSEQSPELDSASVASEVFRRIVGSAIALASVPVASDSIDMIDNVDLELSIAVASTSGARLIFSIGCPSDDSATLEADSVTGLLTVNNEAGDSSLATVTRVSASLVTVVVKAEAIYELGLGGFVLELREVDGSATTSLWEAGATIRRTSGRITA